MIQRPLDECVCVCCRELPVRLYISKYKYISILYINALLVRLYKLSHIAGGVATGWVTKYNIKCECNVFSQREGERERESKNTKETQNIHTGGLDSERERETESNQNAEW